MKLDWMGNYRSVVEAMIGMCNSYSQCMNQPVFETDCVSLSPSQLQVLEYILENEDRNENMSRIAQRLSISQSNFSKMVKQLVKKGLLEKYHTADNGKNIIIRVSPAGKRFYDIYSHCEMTDVWRRIFEKLDSVKPEDVEVFVSCLAEFTDVMQGGINKSTPKKDGVELIKVE